MLILSLLYCTALPPYYCAIRYAVVRRCCRALGMREVEEDKKWSLFWADGAVHHGRVATLKSWQIINHFPDMAEICRKDLLARNVSRMQEQFPTDFAFLPQTWEMYAERHARYPFCSLFVSFIFGVIVFLLLLLLLYIYFRC